MTKGNGFSLIELTIVFVVVGLVAGGILAGRDMVKSAGLRSTLMQVQKFQTATGAFMAKYGYLPGDMPTRTASRYGFITRGTCGGQGDGDGRITGTWGCGVVGNGHVIGSGESVSFWSDLTRAGLMDGNLDNVVSESDVPAADIIGSNIAKYLPQAKTGAENYFYAWSSSTIVVATEYLRGKNYFGLAGVRNIACNTMACKLANTVMPLSATEASNMDSKTDDGLPITGKSVSIYLSNDPIWSDGTNMLYTPWVPAQTAASATSCFDNNNVSGALEEYTLDQNTDAKNCAISFQFN